jgi:hypothetical protein
MVWPEADTLKRLYAIVPFDQRVQRITSRIWAKFKAGA